MQIELAVNCWNYQHRLNWMLCSILQQKGDIPDIVFNVSYVPKNGNPNTEEVCSFFKDKGLKIKETLLKDKKEVSCRGKIRQKQMKASEADWILFADCDMIYHSLFFDVLKKRLEGNLKDVKKVITADRISLSIPFCTEYFEKHSDGYPKAIENVAEIVSKWPVYRVSGRRVGPGNFQLANLHHIKKNDISYTHCCRDIWRSTRSDKHFRKNMGGIHPIKKLKPMWHLNHPRGNPEEQR